MTSLPPPLTSKTRSNPSVRTSRNSMSGERVREKRFQTLKLFCRPHLILKGYSFRPPPGFWGVLAC